MVTLGNTNMTVKEIEEHLEHLRGEWKKHPSRRPIIEVWAKRTKEMLDEAKNDDFAVEVENLLQ